MICDVHYFKTLLVLCYYWSNWCGSDGSSYIPGSVYSTGDCGKYLLYHYYTLHKVLGLYQNTPVQSAVCLSICLVGTTSHWQMNRYCTDETLHSLMCMKEDNPVQTISREINISAVPVIWLTVLVRRDLIFSIFVVCMQPHIQNPVILFS